jgi:hypothetical protein
LQIKLKSLLAAFCSGEAIVYLFGNHHKVVVQLPMKYRTVDLAFLRAAEPSSARRKLAVGPVLKNALA